MVAQVFCPTPPCLQASLKPAVATLLFPALLHDLVTATCPKDYLSELLSRQISSCIFGLPTCDPRCSVKIHILCTCIVVVFVMLRRHGVRLLLIGACSTQGHDTYKLVVPVCRLKYIHDNQRNKAKAWKNTLLEEG